MTNQLNGNWFASGVGALVDACQRHAFRVMCIASALTALASIFLVQNIRIDTDTEEMLSSSLPFRQNTIAIDKGFPQFDGLMLVVLDAPDSDAADDAAGILVREFLKYPETFSDVFSLQTEPFLRQHGLLFKDIEELEFLADRLIAAQPFLGTLWQQPNLEGLSNMLALLVKAEASDPETVKEAIRVLGVIAGTTKSVREGEATGIVWSDILTDTTSTDKSSRRLITLKPTLNYGSLQPAAQATDKIFEIATKSGFLSDGYRLRLTGSAALESDELESVEVGMGMAGLVSLVLVVTLLLIGLKSLGAMIALLLTLIAGLVWTAALAILTIGSLNLISVAFAVLFVGLSVDFGIHFVLRVSEHFGERGGWEAAFASGGRSVGPSLGICTLTTAIAFFSFLPTDYVGLAELGAIAGMGMFVALVTNLTILPAFMKLLMRQPSHVTPLRGYSSYPQRLVSRRVSGFIVLGSFLSVIFASYVAKDARFDFDPMNLKDKSALSVETLFDLWEDGTLHPYSAEILTSSVEEARELSQQLQSVPEVREVEGIDLFIPSGQEEKLVIIDRLALILGPAFFAAPGKVEMDHEARLNALGRISEQVSILGENPIWSDVSERLRRAFDGLTPEEAIGVNTALFSGLPVRLNDLITSLSAGEIKLNSLPEYLKARYISADGRARIEVLPSGDVRDQAVLQDFVSAVQDVAPNAAGAPIVIVEAGQAVLASFLEALVYSIAGISFVLLIILRRIKDVFLVFAPVLVAAIWTMAASVALNVSFNFANVIVLPLLFGLSVDYGIHLVMRRRGGEGQANYSTTPRAITLSALTTIGSFGSIMLSGHPGTASMGLLLTISIVLSMVAILVLLPALLSWAYPDSVRHNSE